MTRICDLCGKPYYRSNAVRLWTAINFGHRLGWTRATMKVCCRCMDDTAARNIIVQIDPKIRIVKPKRAS